MSSVTVLPMTGSEPKTYPLREVQSGDDYQCIVQLEFDNPGVVPVLVRFQRGEQELRSLLTQFDVVDRHD